MTTATHHLIQTVPVCLPHLPEAAEGLRIAHLTDLHVSRPRGRFRALLDAVEQLDADIIFLTGDYMSDAGNEPAAMTVLRSVCQRLHPRLGTFGVFGNHDTHTMRDLAADLPVRWLNNEIERLEAGNIEVLGFENEKHKWPDTLELLAAIDATSPASPAASSAAPRRSPLSELAPPIVTPLRLLLSHYPTMLPVASELRVDIMFSGHTHGGQWRLPRRLALYTSCDLPSRLCAGILRHRDTLCVVSRGIGETFIPLRILCPPHLPLFELRRGPMPGVHSDHVENVRPW
jgi:predicted MPP superfamily phosphohydrolase